MFGKKITGVIRSTDWIGLNSSLVEHWSKLRRAIFQRFVVGML
ncbi:MAG: hypothetical protein MAG794_00565 [Gammaproteobacteria bacterium]|nr:hypothetical protein [Gammaproteobacteria bacterium]